MMKIVNCPVSKLPNLWKFIDKFFLLYCELYGCGLSTVYSSATAVGVCLPRISDIVHYMIWLYEIWWHMQAVKLVFYIPFVRIYYFQWNCPFIYLFGEAKPTSFTNISLMPHQLFTTFSQWSNLQLDIDDSLQSLEQLTNERVILKHHTWVTSDLTWKSDPWRSWQLLSHDSLILEAGDTDLTCKNDHEAAYNWSHMKELSPKQLSSEFPWQTIHNATENWSRVIVWPWNGRQLILHCSTILEPADNWSHMIARSLFNWQLISHDSRILEHSW
jgi:hypothetical protein